MGQRARPRDCGGEHHSTGWTPGSGEWIGTDNLDVPTLHLTAEHDRIAPAATAPAGEKVAIASGHVGMIVGSARERLHAALATFLSR